jgi:HD superfamily phosphohydrolase
MAGNYNTIRDPVHGFVLLNDLEVEVISSEPFQRLRYIRQLALTYLVYPGAEHSRFSHSLGVMEFASKIYDTLIYKHQHDLKWDKQRIAKNRQLLRLAALLHDIGHAPFSHASEELLQGVEHEAYSRKAMLALPLSRILDKFEDKSGITAQSVADFFSAESIDPDIAFLREIFS